MPRFEYVDGWNNEENFPFLELMSGHSKKFIFYKYKDANGGLAPGSSSMYSIFQNILSVLTFTGRPLFIEDGEKFRAFASYLADRIVERYPSAERGAETPRINTSYAYVAKESFGDSPLVANWRFSGALLSCEALTFNLGRITRTEGDIFSTIEDALDAYYPEFPKDVLFSYNAHGTTVCRNARYKKTIQAVVRLREAFKGLSSSEVASLRKFDDIVIPRSVVRVKYSNQTQKTLATKLAKSLGTPDRFLCTMCASTLSACSCVRHRCGCFNSPVSGQCANRTHSSNTLIAIESPIKKLGTGNRRFPRHIGVEIEISRFIPMPSCTSIQVGKVMKDTLSCVKYDGSLHHDGAREITTTPRAGKSFSTAIIKVVRGLQDVGGETLTDAGIHMHVDVSDFDEYDFRKLAGMWAKMERAVLATVPPARRTNDYCVPWDFGGRSWEFVTNVELTEGALNVVNLQGNRYKTMNVQSYNSDRKTVEFRFMESSLDIRRIKDMASILSNIVETAKRSDIFDVKKAFEHSIERTFGLLPRPVTNRLFTQIAENV